MINNYTKGNTLIEIVIVIAIIVIIMAVVIPKVFLFKQKQVLKNTTEEVKVLLNEARVETLASKNSNFYGVHFESDKVVLFSGPTFSSSAVDNKVFSFDPQVTLPISQVFLNGNGVDILFDKFTGNVSNYGTITLELVSDPSLEKVITISPLGVVSTN